MRDGGRVVHIEAHGNPMSAAVMRELLDVNQMVRVHSTFQDQSYLYFLMDLASNGSLR